MCPYFNPIKSECRVTPWDSEAPQEDSKINHHCADSYNCTYCGNYEAVQHGDYFLQR